MTDDAVNGEMSLIMNMTASTAISVTCSVDPVAAVGTLDHELFDQPDPEKDLSTDYTHGIPDVPEPVNVLGIAAHSHVTASIVFRQNESNKA